jgi:hypothetical protein
MPLAGCALLRNDCTTACTTARGGKLAAQFGGFFA